MIKRNYLYLSGRKKGYWNKMEKIRNILILFQRMLKEVMGKEVLFIPIIH